MSSDNPSKETCRMVDDRDGRRCVRCGRSLYAVGGSRHHRKLRSQCTRVEKHQVQNLILLCGSGTTGCHGFVHMHPTIAYENGWCVKSFQDQLEVPVRTWHGLVYLTTDGKYYPVSKTVSRKQALEQALYDAEELARIFQCKNYGTNEEGMWGGRE